MSFRSFRSLTSFWSFLALAALLATGCRASSPGAPAPNFEPVDRLLEDFRERGAFPGGVLAVGYRGSLVHLHPFGRLTWDADAPAVTAGTLYDLASLTKVVATTTMAMILVDEGRLDLDRRVQELLPGFLGPGKEAVTVRHLLTHSSGLPAIVPLYKEVPLQEKTRAAFLERILALDLVYPTGSRSVYSDPGIILLGEILEQVAGQPLEDFVRARVFEPLGMRDTQFRPPAALRSQIAPTEVDPWRGRLVHGEVHDENAFALGGVAPHAGLFGTAGDLARFAQMLLNGDLVSRETVELFTRRAGIPGSDRALGWDTKSAQGSSAGTLMSSRSFGHTGFTGTSIWIDPERELFVILLTNRVHPTRDNNLIREARPAVADAVVRALGEQSDDRIVRVGLTDDLGRHRPTLGAAVAQPAQRRGGPGLSRHRAAGSHQSLGRPGDGVALPAPRRALARRLRCGGLRAGLPPGAGPLHPRSSPAAPQPKHEDQECRGLRVHITNSEKVEPYRLGVSLLAVFSRQPGFAWRDGGDALTRLVGTPRLIEDLREGKTVEEILAADAADHAAWRRERQAALLYP